MKAIAIVSGGMDSVVMLHHYKSQIGGVLYFDYGSNHAPREKVFSKKNAESLDIPWLEVPLTFVKEHFTSGLLDGASAIPDGHYEDVVMKKTVVPFRNGIMLSLAVGFAESVCADTVMIANHFGDHAIYPDCRADFINAMGEAARQGTYAKVNIHAPFTGMSKRDIAILGKDIGVNFVQTYSCYKGGEKHCGTCGTCVERKEALQGFDPTEYVTP